MKNSGYLETAKTMVHGIGEGARIVIKVKRADETVAKSDGKRFC